MKSVKHMLATNCPPPLCYDLTDSVIALHDFCVKPVRHCFLRFLWIFFILQVNEYNP